jgi:hypothetical protein
VDRLIFLGEIPGLRDISPVRDPNNPDDAPNLLKKQLKITKSRRTDSVTANIT